MRGYSSLLILRQLMWEISKWEHQLDEDEYQSEEDKRERWNPTRLLPCHYFDFMYGTSTGGLIATMLGRLRMSIPQCIDIYRIVGEEVFGRKRSFIPLATKYSSTPLELNVQKVVQKHCKRHGDSCDGQDWHPWALDGYGDKFTPGNICQSICLTATHNNRISEAHLIRTYDHRYVNPPAWITQYNEGADPLRIWQVTRATSAAPFYFKPLEVEIDGIMVEFKDGGIRENNPAVAAWSEFVSLRGEGSVPGLLLSIGTGRPNQQNDGFAASWPGPLGKLPFFQALVEKIAVLKNLLIKYTDGEEKHDFMNKKAEGENTWYKRLNVSQGLEDMKLDEWTKGNWTDPDTGKTEMVSGGYSLQRMQDATSAYLNRPFEEEFDTYASPGTKISHCAEKLVRHRRAREATAEENPERWDIFMGRYLGHEPSLSTDGPVVNGNQGGVPATGAIESAVHAKKIQSVQNGSAHHGIGGTTEDGQSSSSEP